MAGEKIKTEAETKPKIKSVTLKEAYKVPEEAMFIQVAYKGTKSIEFLGPYCIVIDSIHVIPLSNVKGLDLIK